MKNIKKWDIVFVLNDNSWKRICKKFLYELDRKIINRFVCIDVEDEEEDDDIIIECYVNVFSIKEYDNMTNAIIKSTSRDYVNIEIPKEKLIQIKEIL